MHIAQAIAIMAGAAILAAWFSPKALRYAAAHLNARAHQIDVGRLAYRQMYQECMANAKE